MSEAHKSIVRRTALPSSVSDPLTTPLYASVAYSSDDADALDAQYDGKTHGYTYAREGHPNASVLAAKIDWLEGAKGGVLTSSGMAGLGAIYLGLLNAGDHIVAGDQLYGRNIRLLTQELPRFGISASLVDSTDAKKIEGAITENTVLLVVDNTFTTPASYKPLENGADITMNSVTKLLAGHSDVTLGYAASNDEEINRKMMDAVVTWGTTPTTIAPKRSSVKIREI